MIFSPVAHILHARIMARLMLEALQEKAKSGETLLLAVIMVKLLI